MQQKNLLLFFLFSVLIIVGWSYLQHSLWPPKPKPPSEWLWQKETKPVQTQVVARLLGAAAPSVTNLDQAGRLATEIVLAQVQPELRAERTAEVRSDPWPWSYQSMPVQRQVIARMVGSAAPNGATLDVAGRLVSEMALAVRQPDLRPRPAVKPLELVTLGDDDPNSKFNLKVVLTPRGGGVQQVILNKFEEADKYGLPAHMPLHLLPGVRGPSNLLLHYAKPEDERPLDTLGNLNWTVEKKLNVGNPNAEEQEVVFAADVPRQNVRITKTYTLQQGTYHIGLSVKIQSVSGSTKDKLRFRYQMVGAHGLPIEGEWYTTTYRNALVGWVDKGVPRRHIEDSRQLSTWLGGDRFERGENRVIRYGAIAVQFFTSAVVVDEKEAQPTGRDTFIERARATLDAATIKGKIKKLDADSFILAVSDKEEYTFRFASNLMRDTLSRISQANPNSEITVVWSAENDQKVAFNILDAASNPIFYDDPTVRMVTEPIELEPGSEVEHKYLLYNGPVKVRLLGQLEGVKEVNADLVNRYENVLNLNTLTDVPSPGVMGTIGDTIGLSFLIIKCTNFIHSIIWFLHNYAILPYGICIICVTILVRGFLFPISRRQAQTSQVMQEKMSKLQPELKKLREKYGDDFTALSQAQQELYRRHGVNPFSTLGGCLLLFAQMPIFLGLYYALQESIFLRLAKFLWIRNLAAPDMLIWWSENIPIVSEPSYQNFFLYLGPYFNLLPIIAVALMIVQQKMMTPPPADEQQEMQQKMMKYMMVFFGLMFYKVASGLCLYFIASSLWGVAERKLLPKAKKSATETASDAPPRDDGSGSPARVKPRGPKTDDGNGGKFQKVRDWWGDVLKEAGKQQQARSERPPERESKKKKRKRDRNA